MARVYSAVMGGKASKVDAKELKMEMGGMTDAIIKCYSCHWSWKQSEGGDDMYVCHKCGNDNTSKYLSNYNKEDFYKGYYERLTPSNMEVTSSGDGKVIIDLNKKDNFANGGVTTAIVTDPNEAMADLQSTYGFKDVFEDGGEIKVENEDERTTLSINGIGSIVITETTPEYEFVDDISENELENLDIDEDDFISKIEDLRINDEYKGKGYAKLLMKEALNYIDENYSYPIYLNASPMQSDGMLNLNQLTEFYKKFGFKVFKRQGNNNLMIKKTKGGSTYAEGGGVNYDYDSYTTFDEEEKRNVYEGVQYILTGEYTLVARSLYFKDKDLFAYYKYLQRLNITLEDCNKFALSLKKVFTELVCDIKVNKLEGKKRSFASCKIEQFNSINDQSAYYGMGIINSQMMTISTPIYMACCKERFLERLSGKPIPALDVKNYYSFQTLIHELAHCLDFQYQFKQGKFPVMAHKEYFLDALYKIIDACKYGQLPLAKSFGVRAKSLKRISVLTKGKI